MTTDEATTDFVETRESRLVLHVVWLALLSAAWVIFELTANPALAAVVACAKFGWNDFLTACWVRRADPNRPRGTTCSWFLVASAFWKITGTAAAMTFVLFVLWVALERPQAVPPGGQTLTALLLTMLFSLLVSSVISLSAAVLARWRRVRIWIDPTMHWFRRHKVWPPQPWGENSAERHIALALILIYVPAVVIGAFLLADLPGNPPGRRVSVHPMALMLGVLASIVALLVVINKARRAVCAQNPGDCWSEREDAPESWRCCSHVIGLAEGRVCAEHSGKGRLAASATGQAISP